MLRIKNWSSFQSYKDRSPPWIRLHKTYIDNYDFQKMPVEARALLPMLWLMASEHDDPRSGLIDKSYTEIAFRLRIDEKSVTQSIRDCHIAGFLEILEDEQLPLLTHDPEIKSISYENDTDKLRNCHPETESEAETESDRHVTDSYFDRFIDSCPKQSHTLEAREEFHKLFTSGVDPEQIIEAAKNYAESEKGNQKRYMINPYQFLKNQMYLDPEYNKPAPKKIDMSVYPEWMQDLSKIIGDAPVISWFKDSKRDGKTLITPNKFKLDWIKNNYLKELKQIGITELTVKS